MPRRIVLSFVLLFVMVAVLADARGKADKKPAPAATTTTATTPATTTTPTVTSPPIAPQVAYRYYQNSAEVQYSYDAGNTMSDSGCCFMACLGIAQTHARKTLTPQQILELRQECIDSKKMEATYRVKDAAAVIDRAFAKLGVKLVATTIGQTTTYQQIECDSTLIFGESSSSTQYETRYHYMEGTAFGDFYWNPHPTVYITKILVVVYISISGYLEYTKL